MFLTPHMPTRDLFATASAAAASGSPSSERGHLQGGSQRGAVSPPRFEYHPTPYPSLGRFPDRIGPRDDRHRHLSPQESMAPPPERFFPPPSPQSPWTMRDLPHPDRRDRRVIARASPYTRLPTSDAQPYPRYASSSSPRLSLPPPHHPRHHQHHRDAYVNAMFPRDDPSVHRYAPVAPSPAVSHHGGVYNDAVRVPPPSSTDHFVAHRNGGGAPSTLMNKSHPDDWRDHHHYRPVATTPQWFTADPQSPHVNPRSPRVVLPPPVTTTPTAASSNSAAVTSPPSPAASAFTDTTTEPLVELTLVGQLCGKRNCYRQACPLYGDFCEFHKPSRLCKVPACRKCAKTGGYCIAHGGGRRCQVDGCTKSAKEGGRCIAHGGGKRCQVDGCDKAVAAGGLCATHLV